MRPKRRHVREPATAIANGDPANEVDAPRYSVTLKSLDPSERPRERLIEHGPGALTTAELLAIILRTGQPGEMVTVLAQNLLVEFGGLLGLARTSVAEIAQRKGMGPAKAAELKAALELARRLAAEHPEERFQIRSPQDVAQLLQIEMGALEQEHLKVVLLDTKNRVMGIRTVYVGSVNTSLVRVGEVFRHAVRENCTAMIVVHNHPSGDPTPSPEDVRVTEAFCEAGQLLDIEVLDHIVFGRQRFVSLKEQRLGFR